MKEHGPQHLALVDAVGATREQLLGDLAGYRESVEKIQNRAVFEIPEIFEKILN